MAFAGLGIRRTTDDGRQATDDERQSGEEGRRLAHRSELPTHLLDKFLVNVGLVPKAGKLKNTIPIPPADVQKIVQAKKILW